LCHYYEDQPIFLINYPRDLKAFYMKNHSEGKTVACFDLIFPTVGEVVGGSLRESDTEILQKKAQLVGINPSELA
jgi:asparaginyl-tRNA synthetase